MIKSRPCIKRTDRKKEKKARTKKRIGIATRYRLGGPGIEVR